MKIRIIGLALTLLLLGGCLIYVPERYTSGRAPAEPAPPAADYYSSGPLDSGYFYEYLAPYGVWVYMRPHGYVWVPRDIRHGWRPYTRGHWVWTSYGWTWVSLESWGWAVYHYGRWGWDRRLGWFWVPDVIWAPAWVVWRWGDLYIGWAPAPPGLEFRPGYGFGRRDYVVSENYWVFVRGRNFLDRSLYNWVLPPERNMTVINMTTLNINLRYSGDRIVNEGVPLGHVQLLTNRVVERHALKDSSRPEEDRVQGREVVVYRPQMSRNESARPKEFVDEDKVETTLQTAPEGRVVRRNELVRAEDIERYQRREEQLLEESHQAEIRQVTGEFQNEKARARSEQEKLQVESKLKERLAELRKAHEAEKAELAKRHKEEKKDETRPSGGIRRR